MKLTIADLIRREGREPGGTPTVEMLRRQIKKRYHVQQFNLVGPFARSFRDMTPGTVYLPYPEGAIHDLREKIKAKRFHVAADGPKSAYSRQLTIMDIAKREWKEHPPKRIWMDYRGLMCGED